MSVPKIEPEDEDLHNNLISISSPIADQNTYMQQVHNQVKGTIYQSSSMGTSILSSYSDQEGIQQIPIQSTINLQPSRLQYDRPAIFHLNQVRSPSDFSASTIQTDSMSWNQNGMSRRTISDRDPPQINESLERSRFPDPEDADFKRKSKFS